MKKIFTLFFLVISSISWAQSSSTDKKSVDSTDKRVFYGKNELKLGPISLILGTFAPSYERALSKESAVGFAAVIGLSDFRDRDLRNFFFFYKRRLSLMPYYRYYFGRGVNTGFFLEGFTFYNFYKVRMTSSRQSTATTASIVGLGAALGGKWVTRKGILFELNAGLGRGISRNVEYEDSPFVAKANIAIGYRF